MQDDELIYYHQLLPLDVLIYLNKFIDYDNIHFYTRWPINFIKIWQINEFWKDRVALDISADVKLPSEEYQNFWSSNSDDEKSISQDKISLAIHNGFENKLVRLYKKRIEYLKGCTNNDYKIDITNQTIFILQHAVHYNKENILCMILDFAFANRDLFSWWKKINKQDYISESLMYDLFASAAYKLNTPSMVEKMCQYNIDPDYIIYNLIHTFNDNNYINVNLVLIKYVERNEKNYNVIYNNMHLITQPDLLEAYNAYLVEYKKLESSKISIEKLHLE